MKKLRTLVSLLTAAAMLFLMPGVGKMQVSADGPVTYSLKYVEANGEWRFHIGPWDDSNSGHRELYYLKESIKDGDIIVVEGGDQSLRLDLDVSLSNITFNHSYTAAINVKSVDNVYVLRDSVGSVTGDVTNAYVYDNAVANFNSNVTNLYITKERSGQQTIAVVGTVAYAWTGDAEKTYCEFYNFEANSFRQDEGVLKTDSSKYSTVPVAVAPVTPAVPDVSGVVPAVPTVPADSSVVSATPVTPVVPAAGEYDDVPKTGEPLALPALLLLGAGLCFGGAYLIRKRSGYGAV